MILLPWCSVSRLPGLAAIVPPNPSLHPTRNSRLRRLPRVGELKRKTAEDKCLGETQFLKPAAVAG